MTRRRFAVIIAAGLLAASRPAHASDCSPDFGDKAIAWVNNDAGRQSRDLAKADYIARSFNYRLVGYERLHARIAALDQELEDIARSISALDASGRSDVALAVEREQASERFLTRLHALAAMIESARQQNTEMLTPLDRAGFVRLGLGAVGRETLVVSMREIGASSSSTLAGRYGIYVEITVDENGNPQSGHAATNAGMTTTVGVALIRTGNPYAVAAGVVVIVGGLAIDEVCRRKWDKQRDRVVEAARLLPSKLIRDDEQWSLVEEAERSELAKFIEHGRRAEAAIDSLDARWKTLFGANAARAGAADAVLTVAKVEQIRRDLEHGIDPAQIRRQVAITEVAADVGRVNDAIGRGRIPVLTGCLSAAGIAAEEDQRDGVRFARAQFKALRAQGGFAPLYGLLDQSDAYAVAAEREVSASGPSANQRGCAANDVAQSAQEAAIHTALAGIPAPDANTRALLEDRPGLRNTQVRPLAAISAMAAPTAPKVPAAGPEIGFCVAVRSGSVSRCGMAGDGTPYGGGFANTGDPRSDIHAGANDGSFASDNRRMSEEIEQASRNIELRISTTQSRVNEARDALPTWTTNNGTVLDSMTVRVNQAEAGDAAHEVAFRTATAPLLAHVADQLDAFRAGVADPTAIAALVQAVGGADLRLPDIPRSALPASVPAIVGVTALDANFGPGANAATRAIQRELWKAEAALAGDADALGLSRELLTQAEFAAVSHGGNSNRIVDELVRDSASLRFAAAGQLGRTIAVVQPDGSIARLPLTDPRQLPQNALVNVVRTFRYDQDFFRAGAAQLDTELASGGPYAGRRGAALDTARGLYDRASASFSAGDIAAAHTWLTMAIGALDIATRFIPGVDWGRDVYEAVTGRDLFTGAELDTFDRVSAVIGVISAGVGNDLLQVRSVLKRLDDLPVDKIDEIYEFAQTVDRTSEAGLRYHPHAIERMAERQVTRDEILEVLDNHTPLWSVRHGSYTAVGHVSTRPERIAVAVRVDEKEIRTVIVEQLDDVPFEQLRFPDGEFRGRLQYPPIKLDD